MTLGQQAQMSTTLRILLGLISLIALTGTLLIVLAAWVLSTSFARPARFSEQLTLGSAALASIYFLGVLFSCFSPRVLCSRAFGIALHCAIMPLGLLLACVAWGLGYIVYALPVLAFTALWFITNRLVAAERSRAEPNCHVLTYASVSDGCDPSLASAATNSTAPTSLAESRRRRVTIALFRTCVAPLAMLFLASLAAGALASSLSPLVGLSGGQSDTAGSLAVQLGIKSIYLDPYVGIGFFWIPGLISALVAQMAILVLQKQHASLLVILAGTIAAVIFFCWSTALRPHDPQFSISIGLVSWLAFSLAAATTQSLTQRIYSARVL